MVQFSRPWDGTIVGDAGPYDDNSWWQVHMALANTAWENNFGVVPFYTGELEVQEQAVPDATVRVRNGVALVHGIFYTNTSDITLSPAANGAGSNRIDAIVLEANYAAQTVRAAIVQGTAGAGRPALTQTVGVTWQIPLAYVTLTPGFAVINTADIEDGRQFIHRAYATIGEITNSSGLTLTRGQGGAYLDTLTGTGFRRNVRQASATQEDDWIALLDAVYAAGGTVSHGLQYGFGFIYANSAVTKGDRLVGQALSVQAKIRDRPEQKAIALALETTAGAGLVYALVSITAEENRAFEKVIDVELSGNQAIGGAFTLIAFDTENVDAHGEFDNTATNYDFTPVNGKYLCEIKVGTNSAPVPRLHLYKNGALERYLENRAPSITVGQGYYTTRFEIEQTTPTDAWSIFGGVSLTLVGGAGVTATRWKAWRQGDVF